MSVLWHLGCLLLGAMVGFASLLVHRRILDGLPMGLFVAVLATLAAAWALRQRGDGRLASSYALGWLLPFGVVVIGRPEGDYVIAADLSGYALMATSFLLVVVAVASLGRARRPLMGSFPLKSER